MQRDSRPRTFNQAIHTPDQCRLDGRKAKLADNDLALVCQLQDEVPVLASDLRISLGTYRVDDIEYGGEQCQHPGLRVLKCLDELSALERLVFNTRLIHPQALHR